MSESKSVFDVLSKVNVTPKLDKKGNFSYLSWSDCVTELLTYYPKATWETKIWLDNGKELPYSSSDAGCFVQVSVTVGSITRSQIHPVLNHNNKAIKSPSSFEINTAIQRCLAKAIALHGLSLYVYRGEDLPPEMNSKEELSVFSKAESALIICLENGDGQGIIGIKSEFNIEDFTKIWNLFNSKQRSDMKKLAEEAKDS